MSSTVIAIISLFGFYLVELSAITDENSLLRQKVQTLESELKK